MKFRTLILFAAAFLCFHALSSEGARVIINEVQYHPSNDDERLQFVELLNPGEDDADLAGWKLRGIKFQFPPGAKLAAGGYLVVARDLAAFRAIHGPEIPVIGPFDGRLKRSGEKIELLDGAGRIVESVEFSDRSPWPMGADGEGSTLERICPEAPAHDPRNWSSSLRAARRGFGGSPGQRNSAFSQVPLPAVEKASFTRIAQPGAPLPVSVTITSAKQLQSAILRYSTFHANRPPATNEIELQKTSTGAQADRYEAVIPPQEEGTLVRFAFHVTDSTDAKRIFPSPNEPRPAFSTWVGIIPERARIPIVTVVNTKPMGGPPSKMGPPREDSTEPGGSAFIYVPPIGTSAAIELFDFVEIRPRQGGWKASFVKDQLLEGMSTINIISEGPHRWMVSEHLAYELYRRVGMRIQESGFLRLTMDGQNYGHFLWVEQPNRTFLARGGRDKDGNLYKIRWFERSVERAHEKKTNPHSGHGDIGSLVRDLNSSRGPAQWEFIQKHFNVTNVTDYFAVNMCIQNWDGFFNNYFTYHDPRPNGKWEMIPWDCDKTWGEYDGASGKYDWYEMPLTTGMIGDTPPRSLFGGGPFGGAGWWRPGGFFSGPILANPQFRKQFLARLKEICQSHFTEEYFNPVIQSVYMKLEPEIIAASSDRGQDPKQAVRELEREIETFRRQLSKRRKFILDQIKE